MNIDFPTCRSASQPTSRCVPRGCLTTPHQRARCWSRVELSVCVWSVKERTYELLEANVGTERFRCLPVLTRVRLRSTTTCFESASSCRKCLWPIVNTGGSVKELTEALLGRRTSIVCDECVTVEVHGGKFSFSLAPLPRTPASSVLASVRGLSPFLVDATMKTARPKRVESTSRARRSLPFACPMLARECVNWYPAASTLSYSTSVH